MKKESIQTVEIPLKTSNGKEKYTGGRLYGHGRNAVILSNMDTNDQAEWEPVIEDLTSQGCMVLTYNYPQIKDDQTPVLKDAISFMKLSGAEKIILIGASRGGVTSLKIAAESREEIVAVAAISAPIEYEGMVFYTREELSGIKIPKLLINSGSDEGAEDTKKMYEIINSPKEMIIYPGDAHGTELFKEVNNPLVIKLREFTKSIFKD